MATRKYKISNFEEVNHSFNEEFSKLTEKFIPIEREYLELKKQMAPYWLVFDKMRDAQKTHILDTRAINQLLELLDIEIQKEELSD